MASFFVHFKDTPESQYMKYNLYFMYIQFNQFTKINFKSDNLANEWMVNYNKIIGAFQQTRPWNRFKTFHFIFLYNKTYAIHVDVNKYVSIKYHNRLSNNNVQTFLGWKVLGRSPGKNLMMTGMANSINGIMRRMIMGNIRRMSKVDRITWWDKMQVLYHVYNSMDSDIKLFYKNCHSDWSFPFSPLLLFKGVGVCSCDFLNSNFFFFWNRKVHIYQKRIIYNNMHV